MLKLIYDINRLMLICLIDSIMFLVTRRYKTQGFRVELQVSGGDGYQVRDMTGIRQEQDRYKIETSQGQDKEKIGTR